MAPQHQKDNPPVPASTQIPTSSITQRQQAALEKLLAATKGTPVAKHLESKQVPIHPQQSALSTNPQLLPPKQEPATPKYRLVNPSEQTTPERNPFTYPAPSPLQQKLNAVLKRVTGNPNPKPAYYQARAFYTIPYYYEAHPYQIPASYQNWNVTKENKTREKAGKDKGNNNTGDGDDGMNGAILNDDDDDDDDDDASSIYSNDEEPTTLKSTSAKADKSTTKHGEETQESVTSPIKSPGPEATLYAELASLNPYSTDDFAIADHHAHAHAHSHSHTHTHTNLPLPPQPHKTHRHHHNYFLEKEARHQKAMAKLALELDAAHDAVIADGEATLAALKKRCEIPLIKNHPQSPQSPQSH